MLKRHYFGADFERSSCKVAGRSFLFDLVIFDYRQKKLCGEEDCKRCGDGDINQPCIGEAMRDW